MDKAREQPIEDKLTARELEILRLVSDGLTNRAIGEHLIIGFETVKWYLKQIYSKLQVTNRIQAITVARTAGLLTGTWEIHESPSLKHNLPYQSTPFIGRIEELEQLAEHLQDPECRLLTVVGPGGIGKTRLALEAAAAQLIHFRDGVYFIALLTRLVSILFIAFPSTRVTSGSGSTSSPPVMSMTSSSTSMAPK